QMGAPRDEMHVRTGLGEPAAEVPADAARPIHSDAHASPPSGPGRYRIAALITELSQARTAIRYPAASEQQRLYGVPGRAGGSTAVPIPPALRAPVGVAGQAGGPRRMAEATSTPLVPGRTGRSARGRTRFPAGPWPSRTSPCQAPGPGRPPRPQGP